MVLVERRDGPGPSGEGESDGERWERRRGQHPLAVEHRSDRDAGGGQAAHQRVTGLGGDGPGDGSLQLGAAPAPFVEANVDQRVQSDLVGTG